MKHVIAHIWGSIPGEGEDAGETPYEAIIVDPDVTENEFPEDFTPSEVVISGSQLIEVDCEWPLCPTGTQFVLEKEE